MTLAAYLAAQAWNNAWANHRLLAACLRLRPGELEAPRTGFFPSIRATWNHIVTVDHYYVDAIERALAGRPPNPDAGAFFDPEEPFATCDALSAAQHAVDRRLVALCTGLTEADLRRVVPVPRRAGVVPEPLPRLLAHLFQHQIHHRGQIHAMLSGTSVAPPQLDEFFCAHEAHLRADELGELGVTEAAIWGPPADEALPHLLGAMRAAGDHARVALVVRRLPNEGRDTPPEVVLDPDHGVVGDRWSRGRRDRDAQVTLMRWDVAQVLTPRPAELGDNLFASLDTSAGNLPPGTELAVGAARCVVTPKPHRGCNKFARRTSDAAWRLTLDAAFADRQLRGVHLRVLDGGVVRVGDAIRVLTRPG